MKYYNLEYNPSQECWHIDEGIRAPKPGWHLIAEGCSLDVLQAFTQHIDDKFNLGPGGGINSPSPLRVRHLFHAFYAGWHAHLATTSKLDFSGLERPITALGQVDWNGGSQEFDDTPF